MASLDSVMDKLGRAEAHIKHLRWRCDKYTKQCPVDFFAETDGNGTAGIFARPTEDPPSILSLMAGDALNNLRSALDHLVWQLVLANGHTPDETTGFPIVESLYNRKGAVRVVHVRGVSSVALDRIRAVQPHVLMPKDPSNHELAILRRLSNTDKHRHLNLLLTPAKDPVPKVHFADGTVIDGITRLAYANGQEEVHIDHPDPPAGTKVEIHLDETLFVALEDARPELSISELLLKLLDYERSFLVPLFAPLI